MIIINDDIRIIDRELKFKSRKSSGPGGQNVNKNSTAITLYFSIVKSRTLSNDLKNRMLNTPHNYLTKTGKIVIKVDSYKSQKKNKSEAISRFVAYIKNVIHVKKKRIRLSPKKYMINKRLDDKRKNSIKKQLRKKPDYE